MGGLSTELYNPVFPASSRDPKLLWQRQIESFKSNMATMGAVYTKIHDTRSYSKFALAITASDIVRYNDTLDYKDIHWRYRDDFTKDNRMIASYIYSNRIDTAFRIKAGISGNLIGYDFFQLKLDRNSTLNINEIPLGGKQIEGSGFSGTMQAYGQAVYTINSRLNISGGVNFLMLFMNNTASLDPRFSIRYQLNANQRLSLAIGKYSQHLPLPAYLYTIPDTLSNGEIEGNYINKNLRMMYSNHAILSYQYATAKQLKIETELYLQDLHHVPVASAIKNYAYTMLNDNSEFPALPVSDEGRGLNYGIDLAVEKMFAGNFYFLATGSLFSSKYKPLNEKWYYTRFSSTWVSALTAGKEFDFGRGRVLQVGARFINNGGHRYTTLDEIKSKEKGKFIGVENGTNASQMPAYWKIDGRIAYRFSRPKLAMNISLDMSNLTGHKNPNSVGYNAETNQLFYYFHTGNDFIPLLSIQADF
jgi:hypothetical protein